MIDTLFLKVGQYGSLIMSSIHTVFVRLFSKRTTIGGGTLLYYRSHIYNYSKKGKIIIGQHCSIGCSKRGFHVGMPFYTTLFNDGVDSLIVIGNNCRINGAYIHSQRRIVIGDNCVISSNVNIIDSNGHEVFSHDRTKGRDNPKEIIIGNNVWIGINVAILKGSVLGDNSVISAGCVVKGTVPPNSIVSSKYNTINIIKKNKYD